MCTSLFRSIRRNLELHKRSTQSQGFWSPMCRDCCALKAFPQCSNACVQVVLIWLIPGKSLTLFCAPVVLSCCKEAAPGAPLCVQDGVGVYCSVSSSHPMEVPEQYRDHIQ